MFATGVTIVTARAADGALVGLTANSFNSVSLDRRRWCCGAWRAARRSMAGAQHRLALRDQHPGGQPEGLAERFATKDIDRWADVAFTEGVGGAPVLVGAAASFECFNRSRYDEGDHVIFVGEVERCTHSAGASPLLFHGGRFYTEHPL